MPLLSLGKTSSPANFTGTFTPGGLIPALLTGAYEIRRGLGNVHVAAPNGIGDATLWILGIIWTDPDAANFTITWDPSYVVGGYASHLWNGNGMNPGEYYCHFYQNNGRSLSMRSFAIETGVFEP